MRKSIAASSVALAMAAFVCEAVAQSEPARGKDAEDLRCLAVGLQMSATPELSAQSQLLVSYYWGRLDGRASPLDLEAEIAALSESTTEAQLRADAQRCGLELMVRGQELRVIGERLKQRAMEKARRSDP